MAEFCARVRVSGNSARVVAVWCVEKRGSLRGLEMAGRYDSNPFDEEEEVNPFSVSASAARVQQFRVDVFFFFSFYLCSCFCQEASGSGNCFEK